MNPCAGSQCKGPKHTCLWIYAPELKLDLVDTQHVLTVDLT